MDLRFAFHLPTRIEVGAGLLSRVGELAQDVLHGQRAFIVTDPGIYRAGLVEPVFESLQNAGYQCESYDQVEPNPKDFQCEEGGLAARDFQADLIVAVGGGSVIDSAKAIALLQTHSGRIRDYEGRNKVRNHVTPIVAIPTTAGTGSEVTRSAVITDTERKFKMTVKDVKLAPTLAIVDPETTERLPSSITASTGMDAFVHAIEAFTCRVSNPVSDAMAVAAMEKIFPYLRLSVADGRDREARAQMMVGSLLAGIAFSHADVAAVHCMAEALGGLYDTPHGVANSIFLPAVTAYNAVANPDKHARVAALCGLPVRGFSQEEAAQYLVEELKKMAADIGIPNLRSLSYVNPEDFDALAEAAFQNGSTPSNCRPIGKEEYLHLFKTCYAL